MIDAKTIDEISAKLSRFFPADLGILKKDFENNVRVTLQGLFNKLDLVTREEFDVQADLLTRTQAKLQALEQRIEDLERQKKLPANQ